MQVSAYTIIDSSALIFQYYTDASNPGNFAGRMENSLRTVKINPVKGVATYRRLHTND
jgi:hypothetical protein